MRRNLLTLLLTAFVLPASSMMALESPEPVEDMELQVKEKETSEDVWVCNGCSPVETKVLTALQEQGIHDQMALAVLMGNIKQESKFETTVCEGGKKTGYEGCHRGGFGLIQWTTAPRYRGLGHVARQFQLDPNSLDAQLKWLFTEVEWKKVEGRFKTPGKSKAYYMNAAYDWLRWGKLGKRGMFAENYFSNLSLQS